MRRMAGLLASAVLLLPGVTGVAAQSARDTLYVYGPGGPLPAMRDAAAAFGERHDIAVEITAGPTSEWLERAKQNAGVIFSGSEHMMTEFIRALEGRIVEETVRPLYLRPSAILVRPGNPRGIGGFEDLLEPGVRVLVVSGAGQVGLWEDMAGRSGDIEDVRALRRNIVHFAPNSGVAKRHWIEDASLDAWLIWNIWGVANAELADIVAVEAERMIYRDTGVALTRIGSTNSHARAFVDFLESAEGAAIFRRWGWIAVGS